MAEIETKRSALKKERFNKKSTPVDLTPMVDLGFLLITFFMFTTALTTPMAMNIVMPNDTIPVNDPVCESCVITVLLDRENRIKYYEGAVENNPPIKETGYSSGEIRTVLMQKKATLSALPNGPCGRAVKNSRGSEDRFILIIKPGAGSNFKNFVDITDEATICQIKKYYVDEVKEADKKLLLKK